MVGVIFQLETFQAQNQVRFLVFPIGQASLLFDQLFLGLSDGFVPALQAEFPNFCALTHLGQLAIGTFWTVALLVILFQVGQGLCKFCQVYLYFKLLGLCASQFLLGFHNIGLPFLPLRFHLLDALFQQICAPQWTPPQTALGLQG
jgi:hypothetical protein